VTGGTDGGSAQIVALDAESGVRMDAHRSPELPRKRALEHDVPGGFRRGRAKSVQILQELFMGWGAAPPHPHPYPTWL
jgi:hypothetical protein